MSATTSEATQTRNLTPDGTTPLAASDAASYLAVLIRLAKLGGLEASEEEYLRRAASALGIDADLALTSRRIVGDEAVSTTALVERIRDPGLRVCLLRDAYRLAGADGTVAYDERQELGIIAEALGIDRSAASAVKAIALQEARLHQEFSLLLQRARG
jgi:tellurite resistance protein